MPIESFNESFSRSLKNLLKINGMTQVELANLIGVSKATVSDWCNGKKTPRADKVDAICDIFHCKRADLLDDHDKSDETYYKDAKTARIAQEIYENPELHALFDAADDASAEDLKLAADLLKRMKQTNE